MSDMVGTSALHMKLNKLCATTNQAASPRRQPLDTQTRLFGAPDVKPHRVRDNLKSTIFSETDNGPKPSPKRTGPTFTSDGMYSILSSASNTPNGGSSSTGSSNGVSPSSSPVPSTPVRGNSTPNSRRPSLDTKSRLFNVDTGSDTSSECSSPLPSTPVRVRQPPGGKCAGIF
ncbi:hypothetical protein HDE_14003 [Halotydeus destructor]|nr:hypothetical protein HDE_14003 [Halotydeus destructor]